ncbi:hypothetical protein PHJA_000772200 [Phtheirospermum japonicum]|uniref:Bifunctional inhibitor/plant lipid transfer protein/seed storage helical domain-containing protein n=1 Tax=Phtheirospermum japonicum TaxID=374723 RepID=A0A830BP11_9LAMI|nr:hypothetical protein PHJA_000772200 [Phtheirospermum japonicum]
MSGVLKLVCILTVLAIAEFECVKSAGGGQCGNVSPDKLAIQLASCAAAAKDIRAPVSRRCCLQTMKIGQRPQCLCAILLSRTAKSAGIKPQIAVTIPKRCNLRHTKGTKCGRYTVP